MQYESKVLMQICYQILVYRDILYTQSCNHIHCTLAFFASNAYINIPTISILELCCRRETTQIIYHSNHLRLKWLLLNLSFRYILGTNCAFIGNRLFSAFFLQYIFIVKKLCFIILLAFLFLSSSSSQAFKKARLLDQIKLFQDHLREQVCERMHIIITIYFHFSFTLYQSFFTVLYL